MHEQTAITDRASAAVHHPGAPPAGTRRGRRRRKPFVVSGLAVMALAGVALGVTGLAGAAVSPPTLPSAAVPGSTQFDVTGFIQHATVNTPGDPHSGGILVVNGQEIVIPDETIVILPANALTWQELFATSPAPYTGVATGLAMDDQPTPITTYEVHVAGNRVVSGGQDRYIAGLVDIAQNSLNNGAGYVNFIDYDVGPEHRAEMRIGGKIHDPACAMAPAGTSNAVAGGPACSGTRVQINDPTGRFGRVQTDDERFTVDPDNPTIASATAYPMCIPRTLADQAALLAAGTYVAANDDPLCPLLDRITRTDATGTTSGSMLDPSTPGGFASSTNTSIGGTVQNGYVKDATKQAPIEVGDYVTFSGTLMNDSATPTASVPGASTYVSANTVINNFGAYTRPGVDPAYVSIEVSLVGTGGLTVFGAGEATARTRFEGMSTDPTRKVRVYGIDINPVTGALTDRDWGAVLPDPGPPGGAVEGRWRLRPPCTATLATVTQRDCSPPPAGSYLPPTRELRAVIDGAFTAPIGANSVASANGIIAGQYHAPIDEYLFPENVPGTPIVANNFEALDFLAYGGYSSALGTVAGQLNPWPGLVAPALPVCTSPLTSGPYSVVSGGNVSMSGTPGLGASTPVAQQWTVVVAGTARPDLLLGATTSTPSFSAAGLAPGTPVTVTYTTTNLCGSVSVTTGITVLSAPPVVTISAAQANQTVATGQLASLTASSLSTGPLTFTFKQTGGTAVSLSAPTVTVVSGVTSGKVQFTTPASPTTLTFDVTVTGPGGTSSPAKATIVVNPVLTPNIAVTSAEYRTSKQRLILTVTFLADPNATLTLQPYLTNTGTTFNPATAGAIFTGAAGTYTLTLVGAPPPACSNPNGTYATPGCLAKPLLVQAKSTTNVLVGTSGYFALTLIRT